MSCQGLQVHFLLQGFPGLSHLYMYFELPREGVSSVQGFFQAFLILSLEYFVLKHQILSPWTQNNLSKPQPENTPCQLEGASFNYDNPDFSQ